MALPDWVEDARFPTPLFTWYYKGTTTPVNLTNATITGTITSATGVTRAITGTLTVTDATNGVFRWEMSAADVADSGNFTVQFTATYSVGATPAITFEAHWHIAKKRAV